MEKFKNQIKAPRLLYTLFMVGMEIPDTFLIPQLNFFQVMDSGVGIEKSWIFLQKNEIATILRNNVLTICYAMQQLLHSFQMAFFYDLSVVMNHDSYFHTISFVSKMFWLG